MNPFTVCFFGNRIIENPTDAEKALNEFIPKLLRENAYVVFLVGRDGDFDQLAASAVHRCIWKCFFMIGSLKNHKMEICRRNAFICCAYVCLMDKIVCSVWSSTNCLELD